MKKKTLSLFLALVIVFGMLPVGAFASEPLAENPSQTVTEIPNDEPVDQEIQPDTTVTEVPNDEPVDQETQPDTTVTEVPNDEPVDQETQPDTTVTEVPNDEPMDQEIQPDTTTTEIPNAPLMGQEIQPDMMATDPLLCKVQIFTTATDLVFQDAEGGSVQTKESSGGKYQAYSFNVSAGTYTYTSAQYGTGVLKITKNEDVYLRVLDFTFDQGGSTFAMEVKNKADKALVFRSNTTADASQLSVNLLVPALDWDGDYRYYFKPEDKSYCAFEGDLWVFAGTKEQEVFKNFGYNLSDGGKYRMGKNAPVTFKIPTGAELTVQGLTRFYNPVTEYAATKIGTEGNYDVYKANVTTSQFTALQYVVRQEGKKTTGGIFSPSGGSVTVHMEDKPQEQVIQSNEASIIYNGTSSKEIPMRVGENFAIWTSRAWQAVNSITANIYLEPDKHYYVLSGNDVVSVDEIGTVTALKKGTAVVAVTYDAMNYCGELYSAIRSDRVAVYVFHVGGSAQGLTSGLQKLTDLDTFYFAKSLKVDGAAAVTSDHTTYTFTPTTTGADPISVRVAAVYGYPTPAMETWKSYNASADGSFTINLYEGRNVVEVSAGASTAYFVLSCSASDVTVSNLSAPGAAPRKGETVGVRFTNVMTPLPKLGAIYNPGFGGTVYLEGTLAVKGAGDVTIKGPDAQYNISQNAYMELPLEQAGIYTLKDTRIHTGAFGGSPDTHLKLTRQSTSGTYDGGDAPESTAYYSFLPNLQVTAEDADLSASAKAIVDQFKAIGAVEFTPACHEKITTARKAYDSASSAVKAFITAEELKLLTDAETEYSKLEEVDIAAKIGKETVDGKEFLVLKTSAELDYFRKVVNGQLASGAAAQPKVNAKLGQNITVNEAVLGDDFTLMNRNAKPWTPIVLFEGIFDGAGFSIDGLYHYDNTVLNTEFTGKDFAMFLDNKGTIRNLSVGDSYFYNNARVDQYAYTGTAGIALNNYGTIENVRFHGYVGGAWSAAGIAGNNGSNNYKDSEISNCVVNAKIEVLSKRPNTAAAGIAESNSGIIHRCFTQGQILNVADNQYDNDAAGLVKYITDSGKLTSCYSLAEVAGYSRAAGLVSACRGEMKNNYFAGTVSVFKANGTVIPTCDNERYAKVNYYRDSSATAASSSPSFTADEINRGALAYVLGGDFGQKLGEDTLPRLIGADDGDGVLRVFKTKEGYVNPSVPGAIAVIDAVGEVSLDSTDKQWPEKLKGASDCYNLLTKEEKASVTNAGDLTTKLEAYNTIVTGLESKITGLASATDYASLGTKLAVLRADYFKYLSYGADAAKLGVLSRITDAVSRYEELNLTKTAGTIQKDTDGTTYLVDTADELYYVMSLVAKEPKVKARQTANIIINETLLGNLLVDEAGYYNENAALAVRPWTSVPTFEGSYDGGGFTISGLFVKNAVESNINAMFAKLSGAAVTGLNLRDSYFCQNNAMETMPLAAYVEEAGKVERCSVEDSIVVGQRDVTGLLSYVSRSQIKDCYSTAKLVSRTPTFQSSSAAGLAGQVLSGAKFLNCYAAMALPDCEIKGGIAALSFDSAITMENCYFLNSMSSVGLGKNNGGATINAESKTAAQFAGGDAAYLLGGAFGQMLTEPKDSLPVFATDNNRVIKQQDGSYVNGSASDAVAQLIVLIGNVALDGDDNCFSQVTEARFTYDQLPDSDKTALAESLKTLVAKEANYKTVTDALETELKGVVFNDTDKTAHYDAAMANLKKFTDRGGDVRKITDYDATMEELGTKLAKAKARWAQQEVEKNIKTTELAGAVYYVITSADELDWYGALVNGTLLTNTPQNAAANAILGKDITYNSKLIRTVIRVNALNEKAAAGCRTFAGPIYLQGTFDGKGHTISGMFTKGASCFEASGPKAVIKNLHFIDSVAANTAQNDVQHLGGIASRSQSSSKNVNIYNSSFDGVILAYFKNGGAAGGIIGETNASTIIENCRFTGKIIGTGNVKNGVGGIVGSNSGKITGCAAVNIMILYKEAADSNGCNMGGIAGRNRTATGIIENCYARGGTITGNANSSYLGGLVGTDFGGMGTPPAHGTTKNSYAAVKIGGGANGMYMGALLGRKAGTVENCHYLKGDKLAFGVRGDTTSEDGQGATGRSAADFAEGRVTADLNKPGAANPVFVQEGAYPELKHFAPVRYTLTVTGGTDVTNAEPYTAGTQVSIKANAAPKGKVFDKWTADVAGVVFDSASSEETTVTMPAASLIVTATYKDGGGAPSDTIRVKFRLIGATKSTADVDMSKDPGDSKYQTWIKTATYTMKKGAKVYDLFTEALDGAGLDYVGAEKNYVSRITAPTGYGGYSLSEFTNGSRSGWMYTLNGSHPNLGLQEQTLSNGDRVVWHYVNDFLYEVQDWKDGDGTKGDASTWNQWLNAPDTNPPSKDTDSTAIPDKPAVEPPVTIKGDIATATVTDKEIDAAIGSAKKDGKDVIVIAPTGTEKAREVTVELSKSAAQSIVNNTGVALNIQTDKGTVSIPNDALKSITAQAAGGSVAISIAQKSAKDVKDTSIDTKDAVIVEVAVKSGGKEIAGFGGKSLTVSIPAGGKHKVGDSYKVVAISADGKTEVMTGKCVKIDGKAVIQVTTIHLTTFVATTGKAMSFTDIIGHWAYDAISYVSGKGIMNGVGNDRFDPESTLNRAMMVTILYHLENSPAVSTANPFTDVAAGQWYTDAVIWASENKLVSGVGDSKFAPDENITREQMATILYNYAKYKKYDVYKSNELAGFTDGAAVSSWALDALKWANAEGLITGRTATTIAPDGIATRAEAAAILMGFMKNVAKQQ